MPKLENGIYFIEHTLLPNMEEKLDEKGIEHKDGKITEDQQFLWACGGNIPALLHIIMLNQKRLAEMIEELKT